MGNALGTRRKRKRKTTAKVMTPDGGVTRLDLPAVAAAALRGSPRHSLFDSEEVRRAGAGARPLSPGHLLRPGKLYFLLELPPPPLSHGVAADRLERLRDSRSRPASPLPSSPVAEGPVQIRVRLPRAEVVRLVEEAEDRAAAAERIVALCLADGGVAGAVVASPSPARRERRTRFMPIPEDIRR